MDIYRPATWNTYVQMGGRIILIWILILEALSKSAGFLWLTIGRSGGRL
jgi:hypothetical protein